MRSKYLFILLILLCQSLIVSQAMAQDYCESHADHFDENGRLTLEAHKDLHLNGPEYWFDSNANEWKEWPSRKASHSLEEYKDLHLNGQEWWSDSRANEWKTWPNKEKTESLDCHKKLHLSGPDWWFDSNAQEWKQWPH
ncbi:hypothetical protein [Candidatus Nitrospira salsa]